MTSMIRTIGTAFLAIALLTTAAHAGIFKSIKAESKGGEIQIEWSTNLETGYYSFEIERRSSEVPTYRRIGTITAKGTSGAYTFTDNGAFFKTQTDKEFTYRIKAVGADGEQYSPPVSVSHKVVSSVKRSWGMIKELFR